MRGYVLVLMALMAAAAPAAPEPAVVPGPRVWTADIKLTHPQQIYLRAGLDDKPRRFWYSIVTITNNCGKEVDFYPKCELMTDTFEITPAGKSVSPSVFAQLARRYKNTYPLLERLEEAGNKLLQGEDNAKDIALIWPDFDAAAKQIKVFITGLSNEVAVVVHPVAKDADGKPVKVFLRKTLELTYELKDDSSLRSSASLVFKSKRWIMR